MNSTVEFLRISGSNKGQLKAPPFLKSVPGHQLNIFLPPLLFAFCNSVLAFLYSTPQQQRQSISSDTNFQAGKALLWWEAPGSRAAKSLNTDVQ